MTSLLLTFNLKAQQIVLMKSTPGVGGITYELHGGGITISHTIGQPSPVQYFKFGTTHLLQGFQHPYLKAAMELSQSSDLTISPNPTSGKVMLSWSGDAVNEMIEVSVFDLNGKIVFRKLMMREGRKSRVEIPDSPDGVYIIQVSGEKTQPASKHLMLKQ